MYGYVAISILRLLPRALCLLLSFAVNDFRFFQVASKNISAGSISCLCGILLEKDQLVNRSVFTITI